MLTLTPQARAIATFTLTTMLVLGNLNRVGLAVAQVLDQIGNLSPKTVAVVIALTSTVIGLALAYLSNQATTRLDLGWAHALAQAALLLAVVGTGIALLELVSAVASDGYQVGGYHLLDSIG